MKIRIFQKGFNYSQDGPGNRLVYHLQGCNLHCPWCSNPEGIKMHGGEDLELDELLAQAVLSKPLFFDGGGVTLTGGELCCQFKGAYELLRGLKRAFINTAIETNGICDRLYELFGCLDHLIMDIKHYDSILHERVTGLSNEITQKNIRLAVEKNMALSLRIPLIGGFNAELDDARGFARLFEKLGVKNKATIELLPYHEYGRDKYKKLGLEYKMDDGARVSGQRVKEYEQILINSGFKLIHT